MTKWIALTLAACLAILSGCAETKYVMRLDPEQGGSALVWPAAPETPRFRYAGQLTGEQNFVPEDDRRGNAVKLLHWVVGLAGMADQPVVLQRPQSGMTDDAGRIYVTDVGANAVFVFDQVAGKLHTWERAGPNLPFSTPIGIAQGPRGQILVSDADLARVFRFDRDGQPLGSFGEDVLKRPTGIARDPERGRIYVADTHAHDVKVFDDEGRLIEVIGQRGEGDGHLNYPTHLAQAEGRLYVTDAMNARVQVFDAEGNVINTIGRRGNYVGNLVRPKGVAVDASGLVYIVESMHDSLLVYNDTGNFLMPIGGTGQQIGQFYLPAGAWTDEGGRVYVADMFNGRIVIFQYLGAA